MISEPSSGIPPTMRYYTSHQVGTILQVNPSSVVKWINDGLLRAFRTPGGHRRVTAGELVRFASYHGMPIPDDLRDLAATRVLVADDEPRFLSAVQRAVKPFEAEIELTTAENGIDALVMVGSLKPDVLILDLRMPGMDGIQVLERMKANPDTARIQVIVVSGQMTQADAERCRALGVLECLQKPVRVPALVEMLRETARRPRFARAAAAR